MSNPIRRTERQINTKILFIDFSVYMFVISRAVLSIWNSCARAFRSNTSCFASLGLQSSFKSDLLFTTSTFRKQLNIERNNRLELQPQNIANTFLSSFLCKKNREYSTQDNVCNGVWSFFSKHTFKRDFT